MTSVFEAKRSDVAYLKAFPTKKYRFRRAAIDEVPIAKLLDILRQRPEDLSEATNWEATVATLRAAVVQFLDADETIAMLVQRISLTTDEGPESGYERTYVLLSEPQYQWLKRTNSSFYFDLLAAGNVDALMQGYYEKSLEYA